MSFNRADVFQKIFEKLLLYRNKKLKNAPLVTNYYNLENQENWKIPDYYANLSIILHGPGADQKADLFASKINTNREHKVTIISSMVFDGASRSESSYLVDNIKVVKLVNVPEFQKDRYFNQNCQILSMQYANKWLENNSLLDDLYVLKIRADSIICLRKLLITIFCFQEMISCRFGDNFRIWGIDLHTHKKLPFGFCDVLMFSTFKEINLFWSCPPMSSEIEAFMKLWTGNAELVSGEVWHTMNYLKKKGFDLSGDSPSIYRKALATLFGLLPALELGFSLPKFRTGKFLGKSDMHPLANYLEFYEWLEMVIDNKN